MTIDHSSFYDNRSRRSKQLITSPFFPFRLFSSTLNSATFTKSDLMDFDDFVIEEILSSPSVETMKKVRINKMGKKSLKKNSKDKSHKKTKAERKPNVNDKKNTGKMKEKTKKTTHKRNKNEKANQIVRRGKGKTPPKLKKTTKKSKGKRSTDKQSGTAFADKLVKRARRRAPSPEPPELTPKLKVGSDCAGYGSDLIALNLLRVDATLVFYSEKDAGKRELLKATHPEVDFKEVTLYEDVTERDNKKAPYVDLFCTGAPCQPWSQAGDQMGLDDLQGRGVVLFHSLDYVRCQRPRAVIIENVKGLTHEPNKPILASIVAILKDLGYTVEYKVLDTRDHGIPHSRPRLYILAIRSRFLTKPIEFPSKLRASAAFERFIDVDNKGCGDLPTLVCFTSAMKKATLKHGERNLRERWIIIDVSSSENYSTSMVGCVPCITKSRGRPAPKI